jgi:LacI family transcriptional regulator
VLDGHDVSACMMGCKRLHSEPKTEATMDTLTGAPTLEDVARRAGVSTATVSRCLNNPDRVAETTRARVLEAVQALGYAPNFGARALAVRRTMTVGAVIPTMENAIFARGLQAFQEALGEAGYTLLVSSSSYDPELEAAQIRTMVSRGADGLMLIGHQRDPDLYDFLAKQNVPAIAAWAWDPAARVPSVGFDNAAAMRGLAEEVLRLGHRKLAFVTPDPARNDRARIRLGAIRQAMLEHGLSTHALRVIETDIGTDAGAAAFAELWQRADRPTVVMCGTDALAAGAMLAAVDMGLSVPGDVSVTGFGDIELARMLRPQLTTVHVPHRTMGLEAARVLRALIEGGAGAGSVRLETQVMPRGTLAPPK